MAQKNVNSNQLSLDDLMVHIHTGEMRYISRYVPFYVP